MNNVTYEKTRVESGQILMSVVIDGPRGWITVWRAGGLRRHYYRTELVDALRRYADEFTTKDGGEG